jgi:hypothetical protein
VERWITDIDKFVKDSQYWVKMTHRTSSGHQSFFFKIPYDNKSTVINQTFRQQTKNFECIYTQTHGESGTSRTVEERYKPDGEFTVYLDEKTSEATVDLKRFFIWMASQLSLLPIPRSYWL